jgi:uncharacterized membrane protein
MKSKSAVDPIDGHGAVAGLFGFVKTTLVGGAVFLVPVTVLALLLAKVGDVLLRLAQPLAKRLPLNTVWGVAVADVVLILLAVLVCFLAGLLARVSFANRLVRKAEAGVLWRIPGYGFVKGLTESLDRSPAAKGMVPVLIRFDDAAQLAFEVDHLPDGRRVIYLPGAPDPRAGSVLLMDADRVEPVQMTFVRATAVLRALGRGLGPTLSQPSR